MIAGKDKNCWVRRSFLGMKKIGLRSILYFLIIYTISSCGGRGIDFTGSESRSSRKPSPVNTSPISALDSKDEVLLEDALAELSTLKAPPEVDDALFSIIKSELETLLLGEAEARTKTIPSGSSLEGFKFVGKVPSGNENAINDLSLSGGNPISISWSYKNRGDYNQDGVVSIADVAPLTQHFFEAKVDGQWEHAVDEAIDGNGDDSIDIRDVATIASGFFSRVAGYIVLGANENAPEAFTEVGRVEFSPPSPGELKTFSFELASFPYRFVAVRAYDDSDNLGDLSNIIELNQAPTASLNANPTSGNVPLTVDFDASGSSDSDGQIILYQWDFNGDGTMDRSAGDATTSFTYNTAGTFRAVVTVVDNLGASAQAQVTITAINPGGDNIPPIASLSANPLSGATPLSVDFDASTSRDPDGIIVLYEWDFDGDGTVDATTGVPRRTFVYNVGGDFNASVTVFDNGGLQASDTVTISVAQSPNRPPTARLSANPEIGDVPLSVNFDASASTDPDGNIASYEWDWEGDGVWDFNSGLTPTSQHTYNVVGIYDVRVRVTDAEGLSSIASRRITVTTPPPPTYNVSGTVVNQVGVGVQGVIMSLEPGGYFAVTGVNGSYTIFTVPNGSYTLTPSKGGYTFEPVSRSVDVSGTDVTGQDFVATPASVVRSWGGLADESAVQVAVDQSDNIFIFGNTTSFGNGGDVLILKYDGSGVLQLAKTWGGNFLDQVLGGSIVGSSWLYLVGQTQSGDVPGQQALLMKYDLDGNFDFAKTWSAGFADSFRCVKSDTSGNLYIGGTVTFGLGVIDALVLSYDSTGAVRWETEWGSPLIVEEIDDIVLSNDGYLYAVGTQSIGIGGSSILVIKLDTSGNIIWAKTWGGTSQERGTGVSLSSSGNIYISGVTNSFGAGGNDAVLISIDPNGNIIWQKVWGESGEDLAESVSSDTSGNIYLAGQSNSFTGDYELFFLVSDESGNLVLAKTWGTLANESGVDTHIDGNGNIYITGYGANNSGTWADVTLQENIPAENLLDATADITDPNGTTGTVSGSETNPVGVEDDGGGGQDVLIIKNLP